MTEYIYNSEIEDAIIEEDIDLIRERMPQLTGKEVDINGFTLLQLALKEEAVEIFKLLLTDPKFDPSDAGLCSKIPEERARLEAMDGEADPNAEEEWGIIDGNKRVAIFNKLAAEPDDNHEMLTALLACPHAKCSPSYKEGAVLDNEEYVSKLFTNPSTIITEDFIIEHLTCGYEEVEKKIHAHIANMPSEYLRQALMIAFENLIIARTHDADIDEYIEHNSVYYPALSAEDSTRLVEHVRKLKLYPDCIRTMVMHMDATKLSQNMLNQILIETLEKTWLPGENGNDYLDTEYIDHLWPAIDVNELREHPSKDNSQHILDVVLKSSGDNLSPSDVYIYDKLLEDPRLNLSPERLASTLLGSLQHYVNREGEDPDIGKFIALKNFNPNVKINGTPLLYSVVKQIVHNLNSSGGDGSEEEYLNKIIDKIINHPNFDPYITSATSDSLAEKIRSLTTMSEHTIPQAICERAAETVEEEMKKPRKATLKRLDKAFKNPIPAGELLTKEQQPILPITIAASIGRLPHYLKLDEWLTDLSDVRPYQEALNQLPETFKQKYASQLTECHDALAEFCTRFNRTSDAPASGSHLKRYLQRPGNTGMSRSAGDE